jgi:hypothetical protein
MAALNFNALEVAPDMGVMDPLPEGWYNVMIDNSEISPTKNGDGAILKLRFKVVDGNFINRSVYGRLNIRNANDIAQRIALAQLSAISHAVGIMQVSDSQQLHGIPLKIRVKVVEQEGYSPSNDIIAYKNVNETVGVAQVAPVAILPPVVPVLQPIPAFVPPVSTSLATGIAPAILGAAPAQAWAQPAPVAQPVAIEVPQVAQPAPEPATEAAFDPSQPPAWMTK